MLPSLVSCIGVAFLSATSTAELQPLPEGWRERPTVDWLIKAPTQRAAVYRGMHDNEIVMTNGLISRTWRISPNAATVAFDNIMTGESMLRGVKPEAIVETDGVRREVGGLKGQPNYAFLRPKWIDRLRADPGAMRFIGFEVGKPKPRLAWKRVRHHAPGAQWPPNGAHLRIDFEMPQHQPTAPKSAETSPIRVSVHYEMYDAIPCMSKWIVVHNQSERSVKLDSFTSEILAAVEHGSAVEFGGHPFDSPNIHVETDYAFGGSTHSSSNHSVVHWMSDPEYATQVNYERKTPCLLEVRPMLGPAVTIEPSESFNSFRTFLLPFDSTERDRQGLALRRMYRTIAPWVTENPLMMHVRVADPDSVRVGIDQCAAVGFELVILTFGSGFNIENDDPAYIAGWKRLTDYAHEQGVEIGGYSLLASRSINAENDVINPKTGKPGGFATFGNSPCLGSPWSEEYFRKLYAFFEATGFDLLEHDGSYPGDCCASTTHPGHVRYEDSQWRQWRTITDFYKWCRANGIYLNVPDFYFLAGSTKCAMSYRETNWSLPRDQQVIHTRQNIYDGTWEKTPSMGWMFVPLTTYHGGGAAATVEPLDEHLDHYERMLVSNLAMGVQACYRGPRLYDTQRTRDMVRRRVDWFKKYRDILESDVIHGRRADGRDLDWMLHVNPDLRHKGMLVVFNPLDTPLQRTLDVDLYYTGLTDVALIRERENPVQRYVLDRSFHVRVPVSVEANGMTWFVVE